MMIDIGESFSFIQFDLNTQKHLPFAEYYLSSNEDLKPDHIMTFDELSGFLAVNHHQKELNVILVD